MGLPSSVKGVLFCWRRAANCDAQIRAPGATERADSAVGDQVWDHPIAGRKVGHALPHRHDIAHAFVSENDREALRCLAFNDVQVGVTQARGQKSDHDLARAGIGKGHLVNLKRLVRAQRDGCFGNNWHRPAPRCGVQTANGARQDVTAASHPLARSDESSLYKLPTLTRYGKGAPAAVTADASRQTTAPAPLHRCRT